MVRLMSGMLLALLLANAGASGALAQANSQAGGCQPTLMQPCPERQKPNVDQSAQRPTTARSNEQNEPIDYSKRIPLNRDTDFNYGFGGLGLKQKF